MHNIHDISICIPQTTVSVSCYLPLGVIVDAEYSIELNITNYKLLHDRR